MKISMVDENGFTYEYQPFEVEMAVAKESIAGLHMHSDLTATQGAASKMQAKKPRRRSA